jgi:hypothetical protein
LRHSAAPADHAAIQTWAETFAADSLTASDRDALIKGLPRPRPNIATDRKAKRLGAGLRPNA